MRRASRLVVACFAMLVFAVAGACKKTPGPACQKLHDCCAAVTADANTFATAKDAVSSCKTFLGIYPKDPATGDVPGKDFCESLAPDVRASIAKAGKAVPADCQ